MTKNILATKIKAYSYIRMSTDVQLKGDSLRRQTAASQQYATEHDLELAPPIEDIGVSGYRGSNREFGNLSRFLDQIERGLIERGSYLIVESLDRLSRQNVLAAFSLLGQIVQRGVKVVTLMDGQTYDESSFTENQGQIFLALGSMLRAHEESRVKSKRLAAAWKNKRSEARTKKLTSIVPAWLRMSLDRQTIEVRAERASIVEEIFRLTRDGYGAYSVARRLNQRKEPTWSTRASLWHESYVKKILDNRAVLGEYQPHSMAFDQGGARRVPEGEAISDYYPAVIDESLFLAAHASIGSRRLGGRGRKGERYSNLFTGLIKCGHCGRSMRYIDKGAPPKGGKYLHCASSRLKGGCNSLGWRYPYFEQSFMLFLRKVDLRFVLGGQKQDELVASLRQRRLQIGSEVARAMTAIENLVTAIADSPALALSKRVAELEARVAGWNQERDEIASALNEIEQSKAVMSKEEIAVLLDLIQDTGAPDFDDKPRRLLAGELQRVIRKIELFSSSPIRPWEIEEGVELTTWQRQMASSHYIVHYVTGESEYIRPHEAMSTIYPTNTREKIEALRDKTGRFIERSGGRGN
jgi:DNA invertase Pin-like site-specific DNA recombinase